MPMIDGKFFPEGAGMTKQDVIDLITIRWDGSMEPWMSLRDPDINKLSDERAQRFVNEYYNGGEVLEDALIDGFGADDTADAIEKLVQALAQEIQSD